VSTKPPAGTSTAGRRLWESVLGPYELDEHELGLLVEAVRTVTLLEQLDAAVRRDGALVGSPQGMKAHPAARRGKATEDRSRSLARWATPPGRRGGGRPAAAPRRCSGHVRDYGRRVVRKRAAAVTLALGEVPLELWAGRCREVWAAGWAADPPLWRGVEPS
jgi:hypothetical protein